MNDNTAISFDAHFDRTLGGEEIPLDQFGRGTPSFVLVELL